MNYIHNILLFYSQVTVWMKKFWNSIVGCIVRLTYLQILKAIVLDKDKVIIRCTTATTNGYLFFWSSRQYYFTYPESSGWCLKEVSNVHRSSVFHYFISYKSQCLSSIDWYNVLYSQVWWSFWEKEQREGLLRMEMTRKIRCWGFLETTSKTSTTDMPLFSSHVSF